MQGPFRELEVRMTGDGYPSVGVCGMEKLPMAAFLSPQHPTLALEPVEDIPNLHAFMFAAWRTTSICPTTRITDLSGKRALAANPASEDPSASKLKRRAAVRVHPMIRHL